MRFAVLHGVRPVVETVPPAHVNEALSHLRAGDARFRIVLTTEGQP